jgi:hypothetical protein
VRGHPPLQVILLVLGFCLVAIPLARLTGSSPATARRGPEAVAPGEQETVNRAIPAVVVVRFAHSPKRLSLRQGERELILVQAPERSPIEADVSIEAGGEAPDFIVDAEWRSGTPETAVTVEVSPDGMETRSATHWSLDAAMQQVFHIAWK